MIIRECHQVGFTLIELSIVLVIIGLIVGGVLVGRDLIEVSRLRSTIKQIESFNFSVNMFNMKYNCLPGDCINATDFFPADPNCNVSHAAPLNQACNGNGDGVIGGYDVSDPNWPITVHETFMFWNHLGLAGLIAGQFPSNQYLPYGVPGTNVPPSFNTAGVEVMRIGIGIGGALPGSTNNRHFFVVGIQPPSNILFGMSAGNYGGRAFTPNQANWIDSKVDDGLPYSGSVQGTWDFFSDSCGLRGYPAIIACDFRYLNAAAFFDVSGLKTLSIR